MINKKIRLLLLSVVFIATTAIVVFADRDFFAVVSFEEPKIDHTPITNVSSIDKKLNAGVKMDFGMFSDADAKAELVYSLDNSPESSVPYSGTIKKDEQFFISTDVGNHDNIKYQIKA